MIPFKKVYRMRAEYNDAQPDEWTVVMGLTPLPKEAGLWFLRASTAFPASSAKGKVVLGSEGKIVVLGSRARYVFEPLNKKRFRDMRAQVVGFEHLDKALPSDEWLQSWYWDEFGHDGEGAELTQAQVINQLN